jgi:predicted DNA-binding transcriptional regulator YafY
LARVLPNCCVATLIAWQFLSDGEYKNETFSLRGEKRHQLSPARVNLDSLISRLPAMLPVKTTERDSFGYRLIQILKKLNQGEKLDPQALAEEFNVSLRAIQRDLKERFAFLQLEKTKGRYHLHTAFLGKLSLRDIEHFARLAGVSGLFPTKHDDFLREIFDARVQSALLVKGHHYEDLGGKENSFRQLEQAILAHKKIAYIYRKNDGTKSYAEIEPYKLVNQGGIWYLAGKDGDKLKAFTFTKIDQLQISDVTFSVDPAVEITLATEDSIWLNNTKLEIVLKISAPVADYFKRRKLLANQVIEKELEDGCLLVSCKVAHPNQIFPIVRYWLPNVRIISPEGYQAALEADLIAYLTSQLDPTNQTTGDNHV